MKVSILIVYLRDQCDCHFFIFLTLILHESAPTISESSIIAETDNLKRGGEFAFPVHKAAKKASMLFVFLGGQHDYHFFISPS